MTRPQRNNPEKFGRFDGLLPKAEGRVKPDNSSLSKELDIHGLPEGEWVTRGVYKMVREFPYGSSYGRESIASPSESGAALCHWGGDPVPVFLDTETTGLSGGTGTYAFLIGLGIGGEDSFRVIQLFLAGPAWEKNWLAAVEDELPRRCGLVTYNGRAFDLPLLRTRYTLARSVPSWNGVPHMDLLAITRHFYKERLSSCSLSSIERNVLGLQRSGEDVPGSQIPWMYTQFLRSQDASPLRGIFYHNTLDIVSLAVLQNRVAAMMRGECSGAADMIKVGDLWASKGFREKAKEAWHSASEITREPHDAYMRLADSARFEGKYKEAYEFYALALETERRPVAALIAMAKIAEHRFGRIEDALAHAEEAKKWLEAHRIFRDRHWVNDHNDLRVRIERLRRKSAAKKKKSKETENTSDTV